MNEVLLRHVIRECLLSGEVPGFLNEENLVSKHFADSTRQTGRPRPRKYLQWLMDGKPQPNSGVAKKKSYESEIQSFVDKDQKGDAFNVDQGGRFYYVDKNGNLSAATFSASQSVELMTFAKTQATAAGSEASGYPSNPDQGTKGKFKGSVALKIKLTAIPTEDKLKFADQPAPAHNGDGIAYVLLGDNVLNHTLSLGGAKGALSDQLVGQAVENAVAYALTPDATEADVIKAATTDERIGSAYNNAPALEQADFKTIISNAFKETKNQLAQLNQGRTDGALEVGSGLDTSKTGKVDVHGMRGKKEVDIHVKFNDPRRLFGLQPPKKSKDKDGKEVEVPGSKGTVKYKEKRNSLVLAKLPTADSYRVWWKDQLKKNESVVNTYMVPASSPLQPQEPDETFMKVLSKGTYAVQLTDMPIIASADGEGNKTMGGAFLDPRSIMRGHHGPRSKNKHLTSGINSLLQTSGDKKSWLEAQFGAAMTALETDISDKIGGTGNETHYFNYTTAGTRVTLDVVSFDFPDAKDMTVEIQASESPRLGRAFEVIVSVKEAKYNPFYVEITSIPRGHPLQVHKTSTGGSNGPITTGKGSTAKRHGDLLDFVGLAKEGRQPGSKILTRVSGQKRSMIISEQKLRRTIRNLLISEAFTKTDEDRIGVLTRKELDASWKKDREKKVQAMIDKSTKNAYRNDDFYRVIGKIWKELMKVYAEEQYQHARRFTRYDVPMARIRP
jgi:hypothetical protein